MAKIKFGMMRFEEDKLEYAGAFNTPPNHRVIVSVHSINSNHQVLVHRPFG